MSPSASHVPGLARVVVTGVGLTSPNGNSLEEYRANLLAGRSGVRDYWVMETEDGQRLWLFYGHGHLMSSGWFCQGVFA